MRERPSWWSVVWTDRVCNQALVLAVPILIFGVLVALTGEVPGGRHKPAVPVSPAVAGTILASSVALTLLLAGYVARRVGRIQTLCLHGREVEARVREVRRFRGGQILELEFGQAGATHRARYSLQRGSKTPAFEQGTQIRVLIDPDHPKQVIPLALYAKARVEALGSSEAPLPTARSGVAQRDAQPWVLRLGRKAHRPAPSGDERFAPSGPEPPSRR